MTSSDPRVFLGALGLFLTLLSPLPACANAALNLVTPNELRGTGIALFASTAGLVGAGTGPVPSPRYRITSSAATARSGSASRR